MGNIVGGIVGGILSKKSGSKQAEATLQAGREAAAQFEPFQTTGAQANEQILAALSGGPGSQEAFQNFLGSTGFQSQLQAGQQAVTSSRAAQGLLNSGATARRLQEVGQDLAQTGFSNFLGQLGNVANRGVAGASGAAQALQTSGTQAAQARAGGAAGLQAGIGQAAGGFANAFGLPVGI